MCKKEGKKIEEPNRGKEKVATAACTKKGRALPAEVFEAKRLGGGMKTLGQQ